MNKVYGEKVEITCSCGCGRKRLVRVADVKRGWGKYYDRSCKNNDQRKMSDIKQSVQFNGENR